MWVFRTRKGRFSIRPRRDELSQLRFEVWFEDSFLGAYVSAQAAVEELAGGSTDWPSSWDPSDLDIPDDLSEWERIT